MYKTGKNKHNYAMKICLFLRLMHLSKLSNKNLINNGKITSFQKNIIVHLSVENVSQIDVFFKEISFLDIQSISVAKAENSVSLIY